MQLRRLTTFVAGLFFLVALFLGFDERPNITKQGCNRIKVGMTVLQVQATIGAPPGDYLTEDQGFLHINILRTTKDVQKRWIGDKGVIFVWFDENKDSVTETKFMEPLWPEPALSSRLSSAFRSLVDSK
jgi:hypothetical protein